MSRYNINTKCSVCDGRAIGEGIGEVRIYWSDAKCIKYAKFFMS